MHISDFLSRVVYHTKLDTHIWCFGLSPSYVVINTIMQHLAAFSASGIGYIDVQNTDVTDIYKHVTTTFLGQRYIYVLEGIYTLDKRSQKRICDVIFSSACQHTVVLFTEQASLMQQYIQHYNVGYYITCDSIDRRTFTTIYTTLFGHVFPQAFLPYIFDQHRALHFEDAYLVMTYYYFLGKNFPHWCNRWLPRVLASRISLFQIADYFFRKNTTRLWFAWYEMQEMYPPEFWIAFWSEQMWQAYIFISVAQEHTVTRAKQSVSKLPFSFMHGNWRYITLSELVYAMTYVYKIDYGIKLGGDPRMLELFLHQWLDNSFAQKSLWCDNASRNNDSHSLLSR